MPSLERDGSEFLVDCEVVLSTAPSLSLPPSLPPSPGASGDFSKDSKLSSYGSASTASVASVGRGTGAPSPTPPFDPAKDPEQWPLLGRGLPPPAAWSRPAVPQGLTAADILPLASDPFWCRLRAAMLGMFWVVMAALLASVVVIVINDPQPCTPRPAALPPQHQSLNVSLPLAAMPVLQAMAASRY